MNPNFIKKHLIIATLLSATIALPAHATGNASEASANASQMLSAGTGSVVIGSSMLAAASGQWLVQGIEKTTDGIVFVLAGLGKGVSDAGKFSVKIGGDISGAASVTIGQSVEIVAESAGSAIIASGKVIAFIPSEIGKSLMHHSRLDTGAGH